MITAALLYASYRYFKEFKETGQKNHIFLIYGLIIIIFSNLVYFSYEFSGHFLIITGFYFIYLDLYKSSIELPYEKLALAEEKLRNAAEEKYKNLFNNANDAIIMHDLEGRITSWNHAAEKIFGWTAEEITGKDLLPILVPEESRAQMQRITCNITRGETSYFEPELLRKNGSRINASLTVSNIKDADQNVIGISCIIRDITERMQAEKELKLRGRIIETMAEGVYLIRASDSVIVYANPKFESMFGYDKGEIAGKHVSIVNAPTEKDPQKEAAKIINILNETGEWSGEVYNIRKDRTTFWCYATVSSFEHPEHGMVWISVHTDISERKRMQEELIQSEEKYRTLYESSSDAIMMLDEKGFFDCNTAALRIFGYSEKEDFLKMRPSEVSPPYQPDSTDSLTSSNNKIAEAFREGTNFFEWVHRRKNGEDFPAEVLLTEFQLGGKQVLQSTVRDITQRKKAEEIISENQRLVLAGKAKSEFLAIMSHELRTPLNAIIGFSELMNSNMQSEMNEKQKRYMENILTAGKNLLGLVDSILDLSRVEAGKMEIFIEKISVHGTINDTLSPLKEKAAKQNIILKNDLDPQLDTIETDTQKFKHILTNLLSNAIKFSKPDGGTVTIRTKKEGDMAKFSVSDTGIGIMEKNMGRLFKTFEQLDTGSTRKYGGTGLGLVVSKKLVELISGSITAESRYGEGSTFTFTLPVGEKARVGLRAGESRTYGVNLTSGQIALF
jgi:protein-histidine pros-kinase